MKQNPSWEANWFSASQEMEPKGSLPHSQVPATCPYPEPDLSSPNSHIPLPEDSSWYYPPIYAWVLQVDSFPRYTHQNPVYNSDHPHTRYMPRPSYSNRLDHPKNTGWGVQIM